MAAVITQTSSLADNASIKLNITAPLPSPTQPAKKTNILSSLPPSLVPYAELMRLHQPAGIYAAYVPHLIGVFLAAASPTLTSHRPTPTHLASLTILHALSNTLLRGSACAYNDALDAPYDRQVARCKNRPVARGAVSVAQAHAFAFFLGLCWILTLSTLPSTSYMPAALLAGSMAFYPFCKRVTHFPQLVLGLSLALSQGIGYGSLGVDLRVLDSRTQIALHGGVVSGEDEDRAHGVGSGGGGVAWGGGLDDGFRGDVLGRCGGRLGGRVGEDDLCGQIGGAEGLSEVV
ncbi:hypothetical protein APSETT444_008718 [Aspergillus pseudonomiae]